jgi:hypothetical protein
VFLDGDIRPVGHGACLSDSGRQRAFNPLATDIENLASSYSLKIAELCAELQRFARMMPPAYVKPFVNRRNNDATRR